MKTKSYFFVVILFVVSINISGQSLKVLENGSVHLFKTGLNILWLGSYYNSDGYNNGEWAIDTNGGTGDGMGSLNFSKPWPSPYWGNYKLYFTREGNVGIGLKPVSGAKLDVAGSIAIYGTVKLSSDERLKKEIQPISEQTHNRLYKLNAKKYVKETPFDSTSITNTRNHFDGKLSQEELNAAYQAKKIEAKKTEVEYGFIAQELKEVFPDLVTQDSNGYYLVNYIGLIPILVETVKELKSEIVALQGGEGIKIPSPATKAVEIGDNTGENASLDNVQNAALYQNAPNPFSQSTQIKYYLPSTVSTAYLCIYDLQGKQLKQITLTERGEGAKTISASEFSAGIYLYALLVDGREVDVKRMILTE